MADAAARRFEMVGDGHSKFWQIGVRGSAITVCFGRIGSDGTVKTTSFATPRDANAAAAKLVYEKTKKGYVERKHAPAKATVEKLALPLPKTFYLMYAWHDGAKDENVWFEGPYGFFRLELILSHKKMVDDVRGDDGTWDKAWVPFLQENYSDLVCVDTKTGEIFEWFNSGPPGSRVVLAPTLDAWLAQHAAITEAAKSLDDDDHVYDAFVGAKAKKLRGTISPGYPKGKRC